MAQARNKMTGGFAHVHNMQLYRLNPKTHIIMHDGVWAYVHAQES